MNQLSTTNITPNNNTSCPVMNFVKSISHTIKEMSVALFHHINRPSRLWQGDLTVYTCINIHACCIIWSVLSLKIILQWKNDFRQSIVPGNYDIYFIQVGSNEIQEALEILKRWNPSWQPKFFMSDYSEAELGVISNSFPTVTTYLCDFHREQCWERWVKDQTHDQCSK